MKSSRIVKLFMVLALIVVIQGVRVKKSETVFEFLNNLFTEAESSEEGRLGFQFLESKAHQNKTNAASANSSPKATNSSSNATAAVGSFQGWLRISSPEFTNKNKFPPVVLPNGDQVIISVDSNYFRINTAFDSNSKGGNTPANPLDFWFRLTKDKLYYSRTKDDYNVLGSISYTKVEKDSDETKFCVNVYEESTKWLVCGSDDAQRGQIFCGMKKNLGNPEPYECSTANKEAKVNIDALPKPLVLEDKVIQPIILIPLPSKQCNEKWDYRNSGNDWECTCKSGTEQSPIDLPEKTKAIQSPVTPLFQYEEVSAKSSISTIDGELKAEEYIKIKYFKNALRIFHSNFGKIVTLDGAVYIAEEIVFHTPSEHTVSGKKYDMEMQIIHYGQTKGDISKQVVLSFMFERKPGVYNKFIDDVDFFSLPNPYHTEREITNNLFIPKIFYSSTSEDIPVMKPFSFYTYQGSITFPPCTERTIHYVAADPIPIGSAPLQLIKEAIRVPDMQNEKTGDIVLNNEEVNNNRETQPLNDRPVFFYDHKKYCGDSEALKPAKKVVKADGHYEKVKKQITEFFYVTSSEPSGLPNSFVVSEQEAKGIASGNEVENNNSDTKI